MLAPTVVAAINTGGTTIHKALGIGISSKLALMSDKQKVKLREKLGIKLIIIGEISMVYNELLFQLNRRLIKIFGCESNRPFAGIPMILCGDLYQLPTVRGKPIYMFNRSVKGYITLDLWEMFQFAELTEVIRQRGDNLLIHTLNKICLGNVNESLMPF